MQGEALAWKRQQAMLELIQSDPARALALAAPFTWHRDLPPSVTRFLEEQIDGRGSLDVAIAEAAEPRMYRRATIGTRKFDAFTAATHYNRSSSNIPLHGIAIGDKLALSGDPLRTLESAEAQSRQGTLKLSGGCSVCGRAIDDAAVGLAADIGGETAWFCSAEHLSLVNDHWKSTSTDFLGKPKAAAGGGNTWTRGRKNVLYMRVNFPDDLTEPISEANAYNVMNGVNAFFVQNSYNTTWLTTTVTPLLTVPQAKSWYTTQGPFALLDDAREAARVAGFDTTNYDLDIVTHTDVPEFDWGGLGFVGAKGVWLQSYSVGVTAHELGHNYGLLHANLWNTLTNYSVIGPGTNIEYGNTFDTMGSANGGSNQFSAYFKTILDWLPEATVHDVTTSGVYRINAFDAPRRVNGLFYAAKVRKDYQRDYWLETRALIEQIGGSLILNWSAWDQSNGGSDLLDVNPDTDSASDAALGLGITFSDYAAGVHITPRSSGSDLKSRWIDVQINLGTFPGNRPPLLELTVDDPDPSPGDEVRFFANASDLDGDTLAYSWKVLGFSLGGGSGLTASFPAGEHVVRSVVSDMKGGITSANLLLKVGTTTNFHISGTVLDENGDAMEGVRLSVDSTNVAPSYTDSDGFYALTGVSGDLNLLAIKYGYGFTNVTLLQNPLSVTGSIDHVDFVGLVLTNVSLSISTNTVTETGAPGQMTLKRTGSTNDDLTVGLFVSGTAGIPSDITFSPSLTPNVTNVVVIPAGSDRIQFAFTPVNNATVEPTEFSSVTILEDTNSIYNIVAPLAEARITILDDDVGALPTVTIAAVTPYVPEAEPDDMAFTFSRTGPTTNSLTVLYSASGTATPGTDYPTPVGLVVIPAGERSTTVKFLPTDDKDVEPDETVVLTITAQPTYSGGGASATSTILDDDILVVTVSPTLNGLAEPSGTGRFTVKRDGDLTSALAVFYTLSGTASNGVDYIAPTGAVTILVGQTSADINLSSLDDTNMEGNESVTVTLTQNGAYDIGTPGAATLFIRDDELPSVTVSAANPSVSEPVTNFGSFQISRAGTTGNLVVNLVVSGTATPGADYLPIDTPVIIPNGSSSVIIDVIPFDDLHLEPVETVILNVVPSTNYLASSTGATVEIADDDPSSIPAVGFTFNTSGAPEDKSPGLSVSLSFTSASPVTINYQIVGGTASNNDYTLTAGPLTFDPGELSKPVPLHITDDSTVEPDETVRVVLFDPVGATHDAYRIHTYTIRDNDTDSVTLAATGSTASETGPAAGNFRITRTGSTNSSLDVKFQITGTATAPGDFAPLGNSAVIPVGATFVDVPVVPVNDGVTELDETVIMTLISATGSKISSPSRATILLTDDDPETRPVVRISATNQPAAYEGGASGAFVFTRTGSTTVALTLFLTIDGTALPSVDYVGLTNVITIPAGQSSVSAPVTAIDDSLVEGEETVIVALIVRDTYRAAFPGNTILFIEDNDNSVSLRASDFQAQEPNDQGGFLISRVGATNQLQVFYAISGTASNGVDYITITNSIIIPVPAASTSLPIIPIDDLLVEGSETVTVTLLPSASYELGNQIADTVTIVDNEPMVSITADPDSAIEGNPSPAKFTVRRSGDPSYEFTVPLAIGGSAAYGVDYPPFLTNVTFTCGIMSIDLLVSPTNELAVEGTETVTATLVPGPAYTILQPNSAIVTIVDAGNKRAPLVEITSPTAPVIFLIAKNANIILEANVIDDGDSNTRTTLAWTSVLGPSVTFTNTDQTNTTASFASSGVYVIRLTADEEQLTNYDQVTVVVGALALTSNTLLHWPLDEVSGTNVLDTSGKGHNGVVVGPANWVTNGAVGGALRLNGTNNFIREAVDAALLEGRKQFTLSLWVKAEGTNDDRGIFAANDLLEPTASLSRRALASCGSAQNALEGTIASTRGSIRRVSAPNAISGGWQQLTMTWSNGLPLSLFIDGHPDQPGNQSTTLRGILTNAPRFLIGKGPASVANTWKGLIDDVRLLPRALQPMEVQGMVATNYGAVVEVATNITIPILTPVELSAIVSDDGHPIPPGTVSITWTQISGPFEVSVPNPQAITNTITFDEGGEYVFRIIADDGEVKVYADVPFTVVEPITVNVSASDGDAAELGPNPGEFTFSRIGDLNFQVSIQVVLSGTASNSADYIFIPQTNTVTFPPSIDTVTIPVTPFLDHRTEGDETVVFTIVTNLVYNIGNAEATVMIHDSPYGMWNIAHFTLEELTDPLLSGEDADFDHDKRINFIEYAFNLDPKGLDPATNAPLRTTIELNPGDGLNHINLTYHRWIEPTDVQYEVRVSTNLLSWNSGTNYVEEFLVTPDPNGLTETVKSRLVAPWPLGNRQFITIRVRLRATGP